MKKAYIGLILAFLYIPILVLIVLSFNNSKYYVSFGGWTLRWYKRVFTDETIRTAILSTALISMASALISTILGTLGAIGLRKLRIKRVALAISDIPLLNPDIVTGVSMMLLFVRFTELNTMTVLLAHITFEIPYVLLNVSPALLAWDDDLYHAALDLGAGSAYAFWRVVFPEIFPGILSGFLMAMTMSIDDFSITYFTRGAGVNTLSTMIYTELKRGVNPAMYALSTLLFLAVFVLLVLNNYREDAARR
ncbi:MAG: ABC transporter permease [Lachnospiraceae bacterium]|nr:ABC transporter permease [Lachnospiraceae bacterium]